MINSKIKTWQFIVIRTIVTGKSGIEIQTASLQKKKNQDFGTGNILPPGLRVYIFLSPLMNVKS